MDAPGGDFQRDARVGSLPDTRGLNTSGLDLEADAGEHATRADGHHLNPARLDLDGHTRIVPGDEGGRRNPRILDADRHTGIDACGDVVNPNRHPGVGRLLDVRDANRKGRAVVCPDLRQAARGVGCGVRERKEPEAHRVKAVPRHDHNRRHRGERGARTIVDEALAHHADLRGREVGRVESRVGRDGRERAPRLVVHAPE